MPVRLISLRRVVVALLSCWLAASSLLLALDPNRALSQYVRDHWGVKEGFPPGPVYSISQAMDGYLWIGTERGLVRFDGQSFQLLSVQRSSSTNHSVFNLVNDGADLWLRLSGPTLVRHRNGEFSRDLGIPGLAESQTFITRASSGTLMVLVSAQGNTQIYVRDQKGFQKEAEIKGESPFPVLSMAQAVNGEIWIGSWDNGLFRVKGNQVRWVQDGLPDAKINTLLPLPNGHLWVGTDNGIAEWNGKEITQASIPKEVQTTRTLALLRDRDENIWASTDRQGVVRIDKTGIVSVPEKTDKPPETVTAMFEDREGSIWFARDSGLERIRNSPFVTFSEDQNIPATGAIYSDIKDRLWIAPVSGGLCWLQRPTYECHCVKELEHRVVYSIDGDASGLWIGTQKGGLSYLRFTKNLVAEDTHQIMPGLQSKAVSAIYHEKNGAIWAGTLGEGAVRAFNGAVTEFTTRNGLPSNAVTSVASTKDQAIWLGTINGLARFSQNHWRVYTMLEGLPSENVECLLVDTQGVLWVGTATGLAYLEGDHFQEVTSPALHEQVLGIAEDREHYLWIATSSRVLRLNRSGRSESKPIIGDIREYGLADGLLSVEGMKRQKSVTTDSQGRVWFSLLRGLSVVDPAGLHEDPAPVFSGMETVQADGAIIRPSETIHIPPQRQRVSFNYAGLSLTFPDRVRFRYKLDSFDKNWSDPVSSHSAVYTNLGPGTYRFRVTAQNPSGTWNGQETSMMVIVDPAFWQTWWFRICAALAALAGIAVLYQLRLNQITETLKVGFQERLRERTRIAQELHDTLLQGILSASMQLHVAAEQAEPESRMHAQLTRILELMRKVTEEGRNAVKGLRSAQSDSLDLEKAFAQLQSEFGREDVDYRIVTQGRSRPMHPLIRDEVYRIGREAVVNAFRHSQASEIHAEILYSPRQLRLTVKDNGCGIDPQIMESGRTGHWGLQGMRERAGKIKARLQIWSSLQEGTEVQLSVPSSMAFEGKSQASK